MAFINRPVLIYSTKEEIAALLSLADAGYKARLRNGYTATPTQRKIHAQIAGAFHHMTHTGQADVPPPNTLADSHPVDTLTTAQAAKILGLSPRQLRRKAKDLDGHQRGGVWHYPKTRVHEYAEHRKESP